ncbi:IclR family transcriptional regulator [Sinomonas notoginsengisoli]|uniref:IclR family transcriptional regulator n=1 Tax=Sinomonas notoginsengisoli TaxID=1457311 RepID=UPI001F3E4F8E|nr:IclR family transcriptional regulator [Sinomonas notoginsengisoli]
MTSMSSGEGAASRKLLRVLEALGSAEGPLRLASLAAETGMAKSTAHRLLAVLVAEGWAASREGSYELGPRARAVAAAAIRDPVNASVDAVLQGLSTEVSQTVHLGLAAGDHFIYTHKVEGPQGFGIASHVGMKQLLHSTAIGKCILAGVGDAELADLVRRTGLPARTTRTHDTLDALLADLAGVRERGFALDDEENEDNIRCVAVPVRINAKTIGAISISTVTLLTDLDTVVGFVPAMNKAAARVQGLLT